VKEIKKIYNSQTRHLTLEVASDLDGLELKSVEPLWRLLEISSLEGDIRIYINKKIQGAHDQGIVVKVVGFNRSLTQVLVKFQCAPGYCYEGSMSGKNGGGVSILPSLINQTLQGIAGRGWYDPDEPASREREVILLPPKPLVSVGTAIIAAVTPPEPTPPALQKELKGKSVRGLSNNFEFSRDLFIEMFAVAVSGKISSLVISDIIMNFANRSGYEMSRRGCGPVMSAWVNNDLLAREGKKGNVVIYTITDFAIRTFDLKPATSSVVPLVEATTSPVSVVDTVESNMLVALRLIREKVERLEAAKARAIVLEGELSALELILDDEDLQNAATVWASLQELIPKTV